MDSSASCGVVVMLSPAILVACLSHSLQVGFKIDHSCHSSLDVGIEFRIEFGLLAILDEAGNQAAKAGEDGRRSEEACNGDDDDDGKLVVGER